LIKKSCVYPYTIYNKYNYASHPYAYVSSIVH